MTVIAQPPPSYRPHRGLIFAAARDSAVSGDRIDIMVNGNVVVVVSDNNIWAALDGICFSTLP